LAFSQTLAGQTNGTSEYRSKATFLSQFPNFVEWPADIFSSPKTPFLICVYGDFAFGTSLAEDIGNEMFHGHKLEVRWVRKLQDLRSCQILFVSRSESHSYAQVLAAIGDAQILTVGESPDFLRAGGEVCFSYDKELLQFEVNLAAVAGARLKISSRLLAMARRVVISQEAAKS